ncbi:F-box/LRR-repeat protein At3g59190-like isoform X2 [Diospyros lotus]|nr:F-box/LRR-repeat protein At3g59190-like isoform X2 [Diospyros lotus]XP_052208633.1 F-box/LRR-repeat protein At3g59190-like isoform X2 [Diospyros lotus]XP_052208634.1 F-box/LRR-repeat protein At3g59190-like isoform X2 [Diospyros lotus]
MPVRVDSFKHQKLCEVQEASHVSEDKISNLPDCVLHHILSFLPTKDTVATSILSTRWKDLWTSVPNIDFDDSLLYSSEVNGGYPLEVNCFMNFVERVLLLRNCSADVKKFRLSCRVCFDASRIHAWISAAIKHKVQELDLCLFVEKPFTLPHCVFYGESLTSLKIEMNCVLELSTCISFPKLKTLYLALVTFPDDDSIQKLLSSCQVLQELSILDCEWMNLKSIMVSIPTLKSLTIDDLPFFGSEDELNGCEIKIDAASMLFFTYSGYLLNEICLLNLSSLINASIHVPSLYKGGKDIASRAVKLLRGLNHVKSMRISNGVIESLFLADNVLDHLPIFQKLTYLELSMEIERHIIQKLRDLLHFFPNLESFVFAEGFNPSVCFGEELILKRVPKCVLASLKSVSIHNFNGNYTELCSLKSLLKNALVLERLNIFCSKKPSRDVEKQKVVINQLQMSPRVSTSCVIMSF